MGACAPSLLLRSSRIASPAPPRLATRLDSFEKLRIEGPYKVRLATGAARSRKPVDLRRRSSGIAIETRGNSLLVRANFKVGGGYPGLDMGSVEITLGTHDLTSAS